MELIKPSSFYNAKGAKELDLTHTILIWKGNFPVEECRCHFRWNRNSSDMKQGTPTALTQMAYKAQKY